MTAVGGPKSITDAVKAAGGIVGPRLKWLGSWNLKSGIADWDAFFAECKTDGEVPEIYWFAWGDFISPAAITNGVADTQQGGVFKTRANLLPLLVGVMAKAKAAGVQPIVVLEGEFNKHGCEKSPEFAAWWDSCEAVIRTCPGAKVVFSAGAWGDLAALASFYAPQLARSDMVGLQRGFFLPRTPNDDLATIGPRLAASFLALGSSKPRIIYDCFLSTLGGAYSKTLPFAGGDGRALEAQQAKGIASLAQIPNLTAIVYRDLKDNPNVGLDQYGAWAERFVGVAHADGSSKPGLAALLALAKPSAPPPPPDPCADLKVALAASQAALATAVAGRDAAVVAAGALEAERLKLAGKIAAARADLT